MKKISTRQPLATALASVTRTIHLSIHILAAQSCLHFHTDKVVPHHGILQLLGQSQAGDLQRGKHRTVEGSFGPRTSVVLGSVYLQLAYNNPSKRN